ncbi:MAG: hypothetical protein RLZZ43_686, partial [Actinomycetota bacterium]
YLSPMLHWLISSPQWDGRFVSRYTQMWTLPSGSTTPSTWDRMGYDPGSDNGGQQWRDVYWNFGQNLVDMMDKARAEQRWDLLGVGYVLKAWGWQVLADLHGEIIVKEAINPNTFTFNYDSQQYAYDEVRMLLDSEVAEVVVVDNLLSSEIANVPDDPRIVFVEGSIAPVAQQHDATRHHLGLARRARVQERLRRGRRGQHEALQQLRGAHEPPNGSTKNDGIGVPAPIASRMPFAAASASWMVTSMSR